MKFKYITLLPLLLFLCGCKENKPTTPPIVIEKTDEEKYQELLDYIKESTKGCSEQIYSLEQTDAYGDLEITTLVDGNIKLYQDNFMEENFSMSFKDSNTTKINGLRQYGRSLIDNIDSIYMLTDYLEDNEADNFTSIGYSLLNLENIIDPSYNKLFNINILDNFNKDYGEKYKIKIEHNLYDEIDKSKSTLTLGLKVYAYEGNKEAFRFEHVSNLTFKNNKIESVRVTSLESLLNDTNYKYLEGTYYFYYDDLEIYDDIKIDPNEFKNSLGS